MPVLPPLPSLGHSPTARDGSGVLTRSGAEGTWRAGRGLRAALGAEGAGRALATCGRGWAQAVGTGVVVQVEGAGGPGCRHAEPAWGGQQQAGLSGGAAGPAWSQGPSRAPPGRGPGPSRSHSSSWSHHVRSRQRWEAQGLVGASGVLWETHLRHTGQTPGSDSPARSSGQGGRAGSHPGSGSVGLGCSSPEGRGTGWRAWCLRSKVHGRSQPAGARPGPGPSGRTASSPSLPRPSGSAPGQTPGLRHRSGALTNPLTNPLTSRSHRPSQPVWL